MNGIGWAGLFRAWIVGVVAYYAAMSGFRALLRSIENSSGLEATFAWEWTLFFIPPIISGAAAALALLPKWWRKATVLDWVVVAIVGPAVAMLDYVLWVATSAHFRIQVLIEIAIVTALAVGTAILLGILLRFITEKIDAKRALEQEYLTFSA